MKAFACFGKWALATLALLICCLPNAAAAALPCGTFQQMPNPDPAVANASVSRLAALADGTAWALGSQSGETRLLHFDGSTWTAHTLPAEVAGIAFGAAGSCSTPDGDVWFAGTRAHSVYEVEVIFLRARDGAIDRVDHILNPQAPIAMSASSAADVWAYTGAGDVIRFDGSQWSAMDVPDPFSRRVYPHDIYAAGPEDVWVVGYGFNLRAQYMGYAQHWDGTAWTVVSTPFDGQRSTFFRGVDGSGANDVWIVGYINYSQTIALHWDGHSISQNFASPADDPFMNVAVLGPNDAWATPYSLLEVEVLYHWDGDAWSEMIPLDPPAGATVKWGGNLAKAGPCDLWTTGSYFSDPDYRMLIARLQPGAEAVVFVQDVSVERVVDGTGTCAEARVVLATADGRTAAGVRASGTFSGPTSGLATGTTDDQGVVVLSSPASTSPDGIWCFAISNLSRGGWLYDPALDVVAGGCENPETSIFVSDIAVSQIRVTNKTFQGEAVVIVTDTDRLPVVGAAVTGTFSGPTAETTTLITGGDGTATFLSGVASRSRDPWCFSVDSVSGSGMVYDSALNVETSACAGGGGKMLLESSFSLTVHPSPFNPRTTFSFALPAEQAVSLKVYDLKGRQVAILFAGVLPAGQHAVPWDASGHSSGVYLYRLAAQDGILTGRITLLK